MLPITTIVLSQTAEATSAPPASFRELLQGIVALGGVMLLREATYWFTHFKGMRKGKEDGGHSGVTDLRSRIVDTDRHIKEVKAEVHDVAAELNHFAEASEKMYDRLLDDHEHFKLTMQSIKETATRIERASRKRSEDDE